MAFWGDLGEKNAIWGDLGENGGEKNSPKQEGLTYTEYKNKVVILVTEKVKYYDEIRKQYPETITKDQFYRIAHISKATALHLLQNGLVPCKDTGKKTRRYTIRVEDVILYLIDREIRPEVYRAPDRWYVGRSNNGLPRSAYQKKFVELTDDDKAAFRKYLEEELKSYDDLMKAAEVTEILGYGNTTIQNWCKSKKVKTFCISNKRLIPKISLIDFLVSQSSFEIRRKTWKHILLIKTFFDQRGKNNAIDQ